MPRHPERWVPRPERAVVRPESARLPLAADDARAVRLRAARRFAQHPVRRPAMPERHSEPGCSGAVRYAASAGAAYPRLRLRPAVLLPAGWPTPEAIDLPLWAAAWKAQAEATVLSQAACLMPEAIVLPLWGVAWKAQAEATVLSQAACLTPEAIVLPLWAAAEPELARSSAAAARQVQDSEGPGASVQQATALPREESAAWDAAEEPQQAAAVAVLDAAEVPQQEAEVWAGAEVRRPEVVAARAGAAVQQREVAARAGVAVLPQEAGAPDVRAQRRAALPSAAAWVCHRGRLRRHPAPQPVARLARAMARQRIAWPQEP